MNVQSRRMLGTAFGSDTTKPQKGDYCGGKGLLKKVKIGDASRASGILESSIYALIEGTGQAAV